MNKKNSRHIVVLDGSNIIAGGAKSRGTSDGHRLISAIRLYEENGYTVIPVLKEGTYWWMKHNDGKESQGFNVVKRLRDKLEQEGKNLLFENDDQYIVKLAYKKKAWLVTNDTFESRTPKGSREVEVREREKYPDLVDWAEVDQYTWGTSKGPDGRVRANEDWRVEGSDFVHLHLTPLKRTIIEDRYSELRSSISRVDASLSEADQILNAIDGPENEIKLLRERMKKMHEAFLQLDNSVPETKIPTKGKLQGLKKTELEEYCVFFGIPKSGNKDVLVKRLLEKRADQQKAKKEKPKQEKTKKNKDSKQSWEVYWDHIRNKKKNNRPKTWNSLVSSIAKGKIVEDNPENIARGLRENQKITLKKKGKIQWMD